MSAASALGLKIRKCTCAGHAEFCQFCQYDSLGISENQDAIREAISDHLAWLASALNPIFYNSWTRFESRFDDAAACDDLIECLAIIEEWKVEAMPFCKA